MSQFVLGVWAEAPSLSRDHPVFTVILVLTFDIRPPKNLSTVVVSLFLKARPLGYSWAQVRSIPAARFLYKRSQPSQRDLLLGF